MMLDLVAAAADPEGPGGVSAAQWITSVVAVLGIGGTLWGAVYAARTGARSTRATVEGTFTKSVLDRLTAAEGRADELAEAIDSQRETHGKELADVRRQLTGVERLLVDTSRKLDVGIAFIQLMMAEWGNESGPPPVPTELADHLQTSTEDFRRPGGANG